MGDLPRTHFARSWLIRSHDTQALDSKTLHRHIPCGLIKTRTRCVVSGASPASRRSRHRPLSPAQRSGTARALALCPPVSSGGMARCGPVSRIGSAPARFWLTSPNGGESDPTGISMMARGTTTSIKLTNKDRHEQTYKP